MITGLHHISMISSSEESVDFYKRLGFKEFFRKKRNYDTVVLLRGYGLQLEIFVDPSHPQRATNPENIGLRNFALKVDDIENTVKELEYSTAKIETDWIGEKYCFIADPDGMQVQLHE